MVFSTAATLILWRSAEKLFACLRVLSSGEWRCSCCPEKSGADVAAGFQGSFAFDQTGFEEWLQEVHRYLLRDAQHIPQFARTEAAVFSK